MAMITLRRTEPRDLEILFLQQSDPESNRMAGTKPRTREAFFAAWERIFADPNIVPRVILMDDKIVGGISCFQVEGDNCVGYWIDRPLWGRGIAGEALATFLAELPTRPLHATAARDNAASIHILQKHGFRLTGYHMGEETDRFTAREVASFILE